MPFIQGGLPKIRSNTGLVLMLPVRKNELLVKALSCSTAEGGCAARLSKFSGLKPNIIGACYGPTEARALIRT
jgi:hypothetical protein